MVSVHNFKDLVTEAITAFKIQLDSERDKIASSNADMIRAETTSQSSLLTGLLEHTQTMVEQVAANHQGQIDHVNKLNIDQEAYINKKH